MKKQNAKKNPVGRPVKIEDGRKFTFYLGDAMIERMKQLGGGNASAGIRIAISAATAKEKMESPAA